MKHTQLGLMKYARWSLQRLSNIHLRPYSNDASLRTPLFDLSFTDLSYDGGVFGVGSAIVRVITKRTPSGGCYASGSAVVN